MSKAGSAITKFGRPRAQRQALLKSLADSLILDESIETTLPKAKAVARYTEKLLSSAKRGQDNLHSRRSVISGLNTIEAAHKLVDDIAPKLSGRTGGYFRVQRLGLRRGDSAQMAKVSFVDELKSAKKPPKSATSPKKSGGKPAKAESEKTPQTIKDSDSKIQPKMSAQAPKRSGVRGNR